MTRRTIPHRPLTRLMTSVTTLFTLMMLGIASVQAQTIIYQNDFENPVTTNCIDWENTAENASFAANYNNPPDFIYQQVSTVDKLCTSLPQTFFTDPDGIAGNFFGGMHGGYNNLENIEAWGLAFDPIGNNFISGTILLSQISLAPRITPFTNFDFITPSNTSANFSFYHLPAGETFSMTAPGTSYGTPVSVFGSISGALTPVLSNNANITNNLSQSTLDWNTFDFSVNTSSFSPGDKLVMVMSGIPEDTYLAFDNLIVTANNGTAHPVPSASIWSLFIAILSVMAVAMGATGLYRKSS